MALKEGEVVRVDYVAFDGEGNVFDTTVEKKAVDAGIFNEKHKYRPVTAVIGERNFFEKIDEALKGAGQGKKLAMELEAKDAFGERNAEFIRMVPMRDFKAKKLTPFPGMPIEINDMQGRVQTVSGGRVRVDFNHPMAGKKVKYELEVKEIVKEKGKRIEALVEKYFPIRGEQPKHELKGSVLEVVVPAELSAGLAPFKKAFADTALKYVEGLEKIRFVEEYAKEAAKAEKKEEKAEKPTGKEGRQEEKPAETEGKAGEVPKAEQPAV